MYEDATPHLIGGEPEEQPRLEDSDNPEWTAADFAQAKGPEDLSEVELAAFPKTKRRGRPPAQVKKERISIRLDNDVLDKFRASGPGWQSRINEALKRAKL